MAGAFVVHYVSRLTYLLLALPSSRFRRVYYLQLSLKGISLNDFHVQDLESIILTHGESLRAIECVFAFDVLL